VAIKGLLSGYCEDIGRTLRDLLLCGYGEVLGGYAGLVIKWLLSGYGVAIKGLLSGYCEDIGRPLRGSLLSGY